uniref:Uncharacterized protein DKFZp459C0526 n=1 Tax=Pongo abelii TaxID=9601 RepID=Q5RBL7_PONAB|nr:hypothetical protein [Pongo abelii]
MATVAELKF